MTECAGSLVGSVLDYYRESRGLDSYQSQSYSALILLEYNL